MPWHARLDVDYLQEGGRCVARHRHEGPMRILQTLYPEGEAIAHNVLVHPPGGLVGGDTIHIDIQAGPGAHAVITTPGAARFYRTDGETAAQRTRIRVAAGARLEWLPLETLCYDGCIGENHLTLEIEPGASMIGWDITAFGLPAAEQPFQRGSMLQQIEWPEKWLERGRIDAGDKRLLDGPLGLAGHRCVATLFVANGTANEAATQALLESAQTAIASAEVVAGVTSPQSGLVVVRALADVVEPAMALLRTVRGEWRQVAWGLPATLPRIWAM